MLNLSTISSEYSKEIKKIIPIVAENTASVLLYGEKGTGKSFVAKKIHLYALKNDDGFFEINCKSLSVEKNLEVLNLVKKTVEGSRVTLFLNCVDRITPLLQQEVLKFLKEIRGSNFKLKIISSAETNLENKVKNNSFSEELFYSINSVIINVLPLRQRKEDILSIAEHYRSLYCRQTGFEFTGFTDSAVSFLENYFFSGNIDELKNLLQHAFVVGEGPLIKAEDLIVQNVNDSFSKTVVNDLDFGDKSLKSALDKFKKEYVTKILEENGWNQTKAAKILGIQRTYVIRLINELQIRKK